MDCGILICPTHNDVKVGPELNTTSIGLGMWNVGSANFRFFQHFIQSDKVLTPLVKIQITKRRIILRWESESYRSCQTCGHRERWWKTLKFVLMWLRRKARYGCAFWTKNADSLLTFLVRKGEDKYPRYPLAKTLTLEDGRCKHPIGMTRGKIQTFLFYKCLFFSII